MNELLEYLLKQREQEQEQVLTYQNLRTTAGTSMATAYDGIIAYHTGKVDAFSQSIEDLT